MQPRTTVLLTLALLTCPACAFEEEDDDLEARETNVTTATRPRTLRMSTPGA